MRRFSAAWLFPFFLLLVGCTASPAAPPGEGGSRDGGRNTGRANLSLGADEDLLPAEIATVGWDSLTNSPMVLLRDQASGQVVPIWVGLAEGQAIAAALHEIPFPRPMTHDLMTNLLRELGAELEEVVVHDLVEGTYLGILKIRPPGGGERLLVDTRPSDGLALALRCGAEIRVHRKILEQSPDFDFLPPEPGEQVVRSLGLTVVSLSPQERVEEGLPEGPGVFVSRAVGEAAKAGMRRGDFILEVNGVAPETPMDFLDGAGRSEPGEPVHLRYWRDGAEHEVDVVPELRERPLPRPRGREVIA
jgi:uncharacterized protein